MTRVLVVDDHVVLREGLRRSLEAAGVEVVGEAGDGLQAVTAAASLRPDVVLMDVSLPGQDGIGATRQIRAEHPEVRVVVLTMFSDVSTLREAARSGAAGFVVKDSTTADIVAVVEKVAAGGTAFPPELVDCLPAPVTGGNEAILTKREAEVLQLVAEGASTSEVAQRLFISLKTVKNHLASIYDKTGARDRTQAVMRGLRLGIIRLR